MIRYEVVSKCLLQEFGHGNCGLLWVIHRQRMSYRGRTYVTILTVFEDLKGVASRPKKAKHFSLCEQNLATCGGSAGECFTILAN